MTTMALAIVAEFQHEAANTRKMLQRVPENKLSWKPHEKSMTLGRLVTHIAEIPQWSTTILDQNELDLSGSVYQPTQVTSVAELLKLFDGNVKAFVKNVAERDNQALFTTWTLRVGENVVTTLPRVAALRGFVLSHAIHHRGQLSVFLRLLDVPLPQIYGPTADDTGAFS